jgi:(p)ppGpp synthase/HD superfamily hydrolase
MTNINATEPNKGVTLALITIEVANVNQLDEVQKQLKKIKGVWEVKRI